MRLDEAPAPVPPPAGLLAWLLDRDERVRRVLWVLCPACTAAIVALVVLASNAVLPVAAVLCHMAIAAARGRSGDESKAQQPVPDTVTLDQIEAAGFAVGGREPGRDADAG